MKRVQIAEQSLHSRKYLDNGNVCHIIIIYIRHTYYCVTRNVIVAELHTYSQIQTKHVKPKIGSCEHGIAAFKRIVIKVEHRTAHIYRLPYRRVQSCHLPAVSGYGMSATRTCV